jgi:tetratricopeptide (TPR) repeat protein
LRTLRSTLIDPAIEEHGGRIVQTGGDSLLVVFDSIDGATRCAVKVQQQVQEHDGEQPPDRAIRFRIGINAARQPNAVDLAMRGWAVLNQPYSREQLAQSLDLFERALQIDPELPKALVGLANALAIQVNTRWTNTPAEQLRRADEAVDRVLAVFHDDAMAHFVKGEIQRAKGRNMEVAIGEDEAAIAINPSLAPAYGSLGIALIRAGRSPEAFAPLNMAIRLSPHDPLLNL